MNSNIKLENFEIYKEIVEHITESLWIGDKNHKTIFINSVFCDLTGYNADEIIGKKYSLFFEEDFNENKLKYETSILTKKGNKIPILSNGKKTTNGGFVFILNNLQELKALKKAEQDLIKINKTKDEFISIVGHELRTPLTSIRGYLSMILEGDMGEINQKVEDSLNHSYNSSVRLIKIVNDVLSISKIESGKMEYNISNISLNKLLKSIYKDIHLEMKKKGIEFNIKTDKTIINSEIKIDGNKLKQVLLNLLTNAIKFTNKGGKVIFQVKKINNKIRFEVIDNGIGIPKDKLNILFSKFSQVESSMQRQNTSGIGLGLTISKNFVKEFGSDIKVLSDVGKGSNFYFDLELKK